MRRFRDLPIAQKITWAITLTSTVSLLLAVALFAVREVGAFREQTVDGIWTLAGVVGQNCTAPLLFNDPEAASDTLSSLSAHPQVVAAWVYGAEGQVFARYTRSPAALPSAPSTELVWSDEAPGTRHRFLGEHLWVIRPIAFQGEALGRIVIQADLSELRERLRWGAAIAGGVLVLSILVAYLVSRPVRTLISGPILDLTRTMERVASRGDYSVRVSPGGRDEVGVLIDGFNRMLAQIQERDERLVRLATAVEQAAEGIAITDPDGFIEYVNPAFERMTGHGRDAALGMSILSFYPEEDPARGEMARALEKGEVWTGRLVAVRADGSEYREECTLSPVRDDQGQVTNHVFLRRDVTIELELEEHLAQSQKLEALGTLAGGIAHDFNNILTPILGYVELALLEADPGSKMGRNLKRVVQAAERARELVSQILAFSRRGEQGQEVIRMGPLLRETASLLRASLPKTIDLRVSVDTGEDRVLGNGTQLQQVVMNLCTNAWHAMEPGGGTLEISLGRVRVPGASGPVPPDLAPGEYLVVQVTDTGSGIPPDVIDRIFEPFFTTKEVGKGTGLGLAACHGVVRDHGGDIAVRSRVGEGSTFRVFLPVAGEDAAEGEEGADADSPCPCGSGERVLVVDDEATVADLMAQVLAGAGYEVETAGDGAEALDRVREEPGRFDVLITDQTMPRLTGLALAREVRRIRPDLGVILCTGYSKAVTPDSVAAVGIRQVLMKPISPASLARAVADVIGREPGVPEKTCG